MASIAIMLGGAVLNATTFIGGSYLAKYLSGGNTDQERVREVKFYSKSTIMKCVAFVDQKFAQMTIHNGQRKQDRQTWLVKSLILYIFLLYTLSFSA